MEEIFQNFLLSATPESKDVNQYHILFNMFLGLVAGIIIMCGYIVAQKNKKISKNFAVTILLLPVIMTVVIPLIAVDLKKAVSLAGIFALVRFRSIPGDSKDILYVFFTLAVGIAIGLCYYPIAFALAVLISVVFVLIQRFWKIDSDQVLRITIPEDMNYKNVFDDIFDKYLVRHEVKNVKTSNMGTLFTISYNVRTKPGIDTKAFIDELRTRNGNLNIILENMDDLMVQSL